MKPFIFIVKEEFKMSYIENIVIGNPLVTPMEIFARDSED